MLDSMRRNANSWVFSLVFAVIIFVFAINFGPWAGRVGADPQNYAAEVNGEIISISAFRNEYTRVLRQIGLSQEDAMKFGFTPTRVVNGLVDRELLAQTAEEHSLSVTDEELVSYIKRVYFPANGEGLDGEAYENWVEGNFQMPAGDFDYLQRRSILSGRMVQMLRAGVQVSESDLRTVFEMRNDKVSIDYVRVNVRNFEKSLPEDGVLEKWAEANSEEVQSYYNRNLHTFENADNPGVAKKLDEVRVQIAKKLWLEGEQEKAAQKYVSGILTKLNNGKKITDALPKDIIKKSDGLKPLITETAPLFATTSLFSRNEVFSQGLNREVGAAAFQLSADASFSKQALVAGDFLYVIALKERKSPTDEEFKEQKDFLRQSVQSIRGQEVIGGYLEELRKKAVIEISPAILALEQAKA